MIAILDDLRDSVTDLRCAVIHRDIHQIQANTHSINDIVQKLLQYAPDELTDEERQFVKELMRMALDANQLLEVHLDYTTLAMEHIHRQKGAAHGWYA